MSNKVRIGLVQMRSEKGDILGNMAVMSQHIDAANEKEIDILGFPEASLTGFINPTRYSDAVIQADGPEMDSLAARTKGSSLEVLVGFVEQNTRGLPFVTQAVVKNGRLVGLHRKNAGVFEDEPWFAAGDDARIFHRGDMIFGIGICAEIMKEDTFEGCARQGAKMVFELAAPGLYGEQAARNWESGFRWWEGLCQEKLAEYSRKFGIWIAVATQAGRTVDEDFPGGGYLFSPQGERVLATPDWSEGVIYAEIDFENVTVRRL